MAGCLLYLLININRKKFINVCDLPVASAPITKLTTQYIRVSIIVPWLKVPELGLQCWMLGHWLLEVYVGNTRLSIKNFFGFNIVGTAIILTPLLQSYDSYVT